MFDIMDFLHASTPPQLVDLYKHSFEIFDVFQLADYEIDFITLASTSENYTTDQLVSSVRHLIESKLDYIINEHGVELTEDATVSNKNEILDALYIVNTLDNYYDVLTQLEAESGHEEQLSEILSMYCTMSSVDIMSVLHSVDDKLLTSIRTVAEASSKYTTNLSPPDKSIPYIVERLKELQSFKPEHMTLGMLLAKSCVPLAQPLKNYIHYTFEVFTDKPHIDIAYHIYSLMLISLEYHNNPILGFKECGNLFFNDVETINQVDKIIVRINGELSMFLNVLKNKEQNHE